MDKALLFITNVSRRHAKMQDAANDLPKDLPLECKSILVDSNARFTKNWEDIFSKAKVVVVKWMGASVVDYDFLTKAKDYFNKHKINHVILLAMDEAEELQIGFLAKDIFLLNQYMLFGGLVNNTNLWLWLCHKFSNEQLQYNLPEEIPWVGIYHPKANKVYVDLESYIGAFCQKSRPTVGVLFYRDEWLWGDTTYMDELIYQLEEQGLNAVCVFSSGAPDVTLGMPTIEKVFTDYFMLDDKSFVDVVINLFKFSLTIAGNISVDFLKKLQVPVLQGYSLTTEESIWRKNFEGMNAVEVSISVTLPEFDGALHTLPVAGKKVFDDGDVLHIPIKKLIKQVVSKTKKWALLRYKENKDKKIAIVFHNYPPKNSNIGSAAGLDSIESVRLLLERLKKEGYHVANIPASGKEFIKLITENATNDRQYISNKQIENAQKIKAKEYKEFFATFSNDIQQELIKDWGEAPGEVFNYDDSLLIPGVLNGNIFITVQPPRGFGEDPSKIYHSAFCPPTHHYLAFYYWLREIWQADAVVHVGTHGSLEWLPGKSVGLSEDCYPNLALGDLPNVYPYFITIIGEGIQAKRRSSACIIGHMTPPVALSGVYEEMEEMEKLLDEYEHFSKTQPENKFKVQEMICQKAQEGNFLECMAIKPEENFIGFMQELHAYITDIKNMQMKTGLHILGKAPEKDKLKEFIIALTRMKNNQVPSLLQTVAQSYGYNYYDLLESSATVIEGSNKTYGMLIDEIWQKIRQILDVLFDNDFVIEKTEKILFLPWVLNLPAHIKEDLLLIARYICSDIVVNLAKTVQEMDNTIKALEGFYIEPGPAGSPTSGGADILPTGRNFYGIDPRNLPTEVAFEIGKEMGEQVIERFIAEEGRYPENIGLVLWAGNSMRSHGQCLAEFFYLLGVKPVWQSGSKRVVDLEIIPLAELKRPRIDVMARISGLFRDSMPVAIKWLDKAVQMVAELDEPLSENFVRKHVQQEAQELIKEGLEEKEALKEASFRVFGCQQGTYGAGVSALLEERNWENIDDIKDVYVTWASYAYGAKESSKHLPKRFEKRLSQLDITLKNENNRETNMLSSDDFNAFHGGMIAAVTSLKGSAPKSYTSDSSDRSKVITRSVQEEMKRLFRGEAINPKFIQGMMEHGYKGAADLSNYVAHSFQWDATSSVMEDWMYEKYAEKYVFDDKVKQWMKEVNPWALKKIAETLLEAQMRGMWQANTETKQELEAVYLSIEGELEEISDK